MLLNAQHSCLLLIDVQEKLIPKIMEHEQLVANCRWLLQLAKRLNVPILGSEQYPKGLGHTVAELHELVPTDAWLEKVHFSCASDDGCLKRIDQLKRKQIVIAGIEAHVCVLQTAMELQAHNKQVFVVVDAVSSRHALDKKTALKRMSAAGIQPVTKEMVFFEWVHQAGTPEFKKLSQEFLR